MPAFDAKVRSNGGQIQIFDAFRKKFIQLTPEEWVRQHLLHYLCNHLGFPANGIMVEYELKYNGMKKRPDIGVVGPDGKILLLAECKAPEINLSEDVFLQLSTYFAVVNSAYLMMTNGINHVVARIEPISRKCVYIPELPRYNEML